MEVLGGGLIGICTRGHSRKAPAHRIFMKGQKHRTEAGCLKAMSIVSYHMQSIKICLLLIVCVFAETNHNFHEEALNITHSMHSLLLTAHSLKPPVFSAIHVCLFQ